MVVEMASVLNEDNKTEVVVDFLVINVWLVY